VLYLAPLTVTDHVEVWFSNHRLSGFTEGGDLAVFHIALIGSTGIRTVEWSGDGIEKDAYVGNVTFLSLSEGILMWANDSLGAYRFPAVVDGNEFFSDELRCDVLDVQITASKDGMKQIPVPYYGSEVLSPDGPSLTDDTTDTSYAYVDLDEIDALLEVQGEESYTLSVFMELSYRVSFSALPLLATNPAQITGHETIDFGHINISCVEGRHTYAHISLPYRKFPHVITVPYVKTILPR
jgi:hypothetical protein